MAILRDSGYPYGAYHLMTPVLKPKNAGEVLYNTAHWRTRCVSTEFKKLLNSDAEDNVD